MLIRPLVRPLVRPLDRALTLRGGGFSPTTLFSAGQQGFFFDPSDPSTAYQDSAGTTAGVVGQPVGLRLDKRLGLALGVQEVSNGTFDAGSTAGWANGTGGAVSASSGGLQVTNSGAAEGFGQTVASVSKANTSYLVTFDVVALSGSVGASVAIGGVGRQVTAGTGPQRVVIAAGAVGPLQFGTRSAVAGQSVTIDNVSCRELPGNHSTQSTSPSRPVWAQDASGFYRDTFDGFDDSLTIAAGGGSTTGFFYCAAINVAGGAGAIRTLLADRNGLNGNIVRLGATNKLELVAGNGLAQTAAATAGTADVGSTYVVTAWDDGVNLNVQINQGAVASVARPAVSAGTSTMTEGKDNGSATNFLNGSLYTRVYRAGTVPNATQIAQVQRFNASRAGVTL